MQQDEHCLLDHAQLLQLQSVAIGQEIGAWAMTLHMMIFVFFWVELESSVPTVREVPNP